MKKENNTAEKKPLGKRILLCTLIVLTVLVIVYPIFFYLMMKYGNPLEPEDTCYITALGGLQTDNSVTVSRTTTLDFADTRPVKSENFEVDGYYASRNVQATDVYVLQNGSQTDVSIEICYPVEGDGESTQKDVSFCVDGRKLTQWWSMCSFVTPDTDNYEQTIVDGLADGTVFAMAFPDWPERGTPCMEQGFPAEAYNVEKSVATYGFSYYICTVNIPAGGSVEVRATYPLNLTGKILFPACYQALPCEIHTLIIENADYVELEDENLGITDLSGTVRLDLDPTRTDYFMEFDVEMP